LTTKKHIAVGIATAAVFALLLAGAVPAVAAWSDTTYLSWGVVKTQGGNPGSPNPNSPHGGYTTSTIKCGVCHAVHGASSTGEALLSTKKADACTYCHISPGVSTSIVYGGVATNYKGTDLQNAHNSYSTGEDAPGVTCDDCHQVHGATQSMPVNTFLTQKILRGPQTYDAFDSGSYDYNAGAPSGIDSQHTALSKWCTRCHKASAESMYGYFNDAYYDYESHIMTVPTTSYNIASGVTTQVAWSSSAYCGTCHSSGYLSGSWPHYTPGARFLEKADNASAVATAVLIGQTKQDGVCLRCHRSSCGTSGVGINF